MAPTGHCDIDKACRIAAATHEEIHHPMWTGSSDFTGGDWTDVSGHVQRIERDQDSCTEQERQARLQNVENQLTVALMARVLGDYAGSTSEFLLKVIDDQSRA
jgi:hypothetical protein